MKVLAVGAAGASAGFVVRALKKNGLAVRGLVHAPDRAGAATDNGADEVVVADLADRASLERAVDGVDGVFHVIPAFAPHEAEIGVNLVEVAAARNVGRFVFSSVYHPSLTSLSNHRDKQPTEQAIYESSLPFCILQPAMFMSQLDAVVEQARTTGVVTGPYASSARMSYVDFQDVADAVAIAFTTDRLLNGTFELAAPGMFSRDDLAQIMSRLLDRPVRAEKSAATLPEAMPQRVRDGLATMFEHYDRYGFRGGNSLVLSAILGRQPTTVPGYLARAIGR